MTQVPSSAWEILLQGISLPGVSAIHLSFSGSWKTEHEVLESDCKVVVVDSCELTEMEKSRDQTLLPHLGQR